MNFKTITLCFILTFYHNHLLAVCQPQCVAHARYSASIFSHRVGASHGAFDWFKLAEKQGHTKQLPGTGAIKLPLVFSPQRGLNARFGHVVFVKSSKLIKDKTYLLKISHTNYAGQCRLEHTQAYFNADTREVEFLEGVFAGRRFLAAGFIVE